MKNEKWLERIRSAEKADKHSIHLEALASCKQVSAGTKTKWKSACSCKERTW